jgi:hypothetical protein
MIPGSFDIDTAKQMIGDTLVRRIETDARYSAERNAAKQMVVQSYEGSTYQERLMLEMESVVWIAAYRKRLARIERMKNEHDDHRR